MDRTVDVHELMPQCVKDYDARMLEHIRNRMSATADGERRPS
jgi:hypothetical protein